MNRRIPAIALPLALLLTTSAASAQSYSIREVGFVDVEIKPYRLILMANDLNGLIAEKQRRWLASELADSNIVLVAQTAGANTLSPLKKPVGDLSRPRFWLVAPDNRVLPIDVTTLAGDLLQSPLRKDILRDLTNSLAAVVLLESNDSAANEKAKAKAEAVLDQVNKVRRQLEHATAGDVSLLTLPVTQREQERWTLWGLGENFEPGDEPKVAVVFGRMRRAGPMFQGVDWKDDDLFGRIIALGQACEDELDRKQFFDMPLPFKWGREWPNQLAHDLPFDPLDQEIKTKLAAILQKPALADHERTPRRLSPDQFVLAQDMPPPQLEVEARPTPGVFAGMEVGILFLGIGVFGWIALGLGVYFLENRAKGGAVVPGQ